MDNDFNALGKKTIAEARAALAVLAEAIDDAEGRIRDADGHAAKRNAYFNARTVRDAIAQSIASSRR